jgi:hypothetical protein
LKWGKILNFSPSLANFDPLHQLKELHQNTPTTTQFQQQNPNNSIKECDIDPYGPSFNKNHYMHQVV